MKRVSSAWRLALLAAVALMTTATAQAASGYYRWTDDSGKVQFTQQPPAGRPYQFIRTSTGTAESAAGTATPAAREPADDAAAASQPITAFQGIPARDPAQCAQARSNLEVLNSSARIRGQSADGEMRYLTPDEIETQRKLAQEAADIYCE
ncbi:MAG: DUF4124 domain-containing protein [Spongiibacteraceae bacterium]|jgi:hypothetical protein|nr:DUF4124 domain-containing protein [Spongiibacteraceae bacterium]